MSGFDWHVDSKPGDRTGRTLNLNVMLSSSDSDFVGGELQVGEEVLAPRQGDAYLYPAAMPHRVGPLASGTRHTLVIALTERHIQPSLEPAAYAERRRAHWERMGEGFERVLSGNLSQTAKVHILHGEHLEAQGRAAEAQAAFCKSYRTFGEAASREHAAEFFASGVEALGMGGGTQGEAKTPDLALAESYLAMAACVHPEHPEAKEALRVVLDAKRMREEQMADQGKQRDHENRAADL